MKPTSIAISDVDVENAETLIAVGIGANFSQVCRAAVAYMASQVNMGTLAAEIRRLGGSTLALERGRSVRPRSQIL